MPHTLPAGLKVYTSADGPMYANRDDATLLEIKYHRHQCGGYIAARSKAAAAARLEELGYPMVQPRHLRLASGNQMDELIAAGIIADDGALILVNMDVSDPKVVSVNTDDVGHRYARVVGQYRYIPAHTEFERINF